MKKLFFLMALSAVVCGVSAHPNHIFGVRAGLNITDMVYETRGVGAATGWVVRPSAAFSYEKSLSKSIPLYFETGVGFSGFGTSIDKGAKRINAYFFEAPALLNWHFNLTDDIALIPYLGFCLRVGFVGRMTGVRKRVDTFGWQKMVPFDTGVRAGIGVEYRRYSFRFGYDAGLYDMSDLSIRTVRNKSFQLQLGYRF
mgnify:CR=1 FL=1